MKRSVSTSMPTTNPRMPPAAFCNKENQTIYYDELGILHMYGAVEQKKSKITTQPRQQKRKISEI